MQYAANSSEVSAPIAPKLHSSAADRCASEHTRSQGGKGAMASSKFLENIVILCFERRFSKQNSVIRMKSYTLASPKFWAGYATASECT